MSNYFNINGFPSQQGKVAIITGANTGLGYQTALALAKKEMSIIMACRNITKAEASKKTILAEVPLAEISVMQLDLGKMNSVRTFAKEFLEKYKRLDILINNAGIMIPPYTVNEDGFESQMGTNYFGHFLLTALLIKILNQTNGARVVSLSSIAHREAKIDFDNLNSEKSYSRFAAYGQSKLACLLFALELNRRLKAKGHNTLSVAAHPGVSLTELGRHIPKIIYYPFYLFGVLVTQGAKEGAEPILLASLGYPGNSKRTNGGEYYGPTGFREMKGRAGHAVIDDRAQDPQIAKQLWEVSEKLLNINFL